MKTEQRSEEADCGGVGVFGEVGTEADVSGSVSAILRKVILCGGSLSRGTGWTFRVPEVDVRTGRIPGDFRVYMVFLGWRRNGENSCHQSILSYPEQELLADRLFKHRFYFVLPDRQRRYEIPG